MLVWEPEIAILQYKIANSSRGWNGQNGLSRAPGRSHLRPQIPIFRRFFESQKHAFGKHVKTVGDVCFGGKNSDFTL